MRTFFAILIICFMALAGCQKEVKQYENVKLVYKGGVNSMELKKGLGNCMTMQQEKTFLMECLDMVLS